MIAHRHYLKNSLKKIHQISRRSFLKNAATAGATLAAAANQVRTEGIQIAHAVPNPKNRVASIPGTLIRSDMSCCTPTTRLSRTPRAGCWQLVDFETEDGIKGVMAFAHPDDAPGEITFPLEAEGRYHIFLGINYTRTPFGDVMHTVEYPLDGQLCVKLTRDEGFIRVAAEIMWRHAEMFKAKTGREMVMWKSVQETYWKTADLTGQSLVISPPNPPFNKPELRQASNLSYVKLIPAEKNIVSAGLAPSVPSTRRIALLYCTELLSGDTASSSMYHPTELQWFRNEVQFLKDSDVGILVFEAIRGNLCLFKTHIGDVGTSDGNWPAAWVDPLRAVTRLGHKQGLKVFASMRFIGRGFPMGRNPISRDRYLKQHPQWAKRDRDGVMLSGLSLAFPEVRRYWVDLAREALDCGVDGVQVHLNRSFPYVFYEEPSIHSFKEAYGEDLRGLPLDDPRWVEHNRRFLTIFLRELAALVKEKRRKELAVTILPPPLDEVKPDYELKQCYDLKSWLTEGLVDYVMPNGRITAEHVRRWKAWSGGKVQVWTDLEPRTMPGEAYAKIAASCYENGADGLCLWDGERRLPRTSEWAVICKLGHRDLLGKLAVEAANYYRRVPLKYLDGLSAEFSYLDG